MINPPLLKPGDKIGIAAAGRKIAAKDIDVAKSIFSSWGMDVTIATTAPTDEEARALLDGFNFPIRS